MSKACPTFAIRFFVSSPRRHGGIQPGIGGPRRRNLSTVSSTSRLVVPRRIWEAHVRTLPPKPKVVKEKPDDKPWPRNFQIAGGIAAAVAVPYTILWFLTSNPTLRGMVGPYLPLDRFRKHFGELEWDAQSYADRTDDDENNEPSEGFYRYPLEDPYSIRQQQAKIEETLQRKVAVNVYVIGDAQIKETKQLPADTLASPKTLTTLVGAPDDARIAVDFMDDDDDNVASDDVPQFDDGDRPSAVDGTKPTRDLLRRMSVFSMWHHAPEMNAEGGKEGNHPRTSNADIDRMRLEYTVEKLEKDLRDPACTRDHDDMRAELKQAKRDLSRLKWKRRLGF